MTRGRKAHRPECPERRCVATGETGAAARLIRFALAPDGTAVPDLAGRLPGRGAWLSASRAAAERAEKKKLFSRAFRTQVAVPPGLADLLERLLAERLVEIVSLARKAGQAVTGFEKVRARLAATPGDERGGVLVTAADAGADGVRKLAGPAGSRPRITVLTAGELGLAFGREFAIHAALDAGGLSDRALIEAGRLAGFRTADDPAAPAAFAGAPGAGEPGGGDDRTLPDGATQGRAPSVPLPDGAAGPSAVDDDETRGHSASLQDDR
ncbi:MAG: RNA-binding protein [Pseudomonadota bacterium]